MWCLFGSQMRRLEIIAEPNPPLDKNFIMGNLCPGPPMAVPVPPSPQVTPKQDGVLQPLRGVTAGVTVPCKGTFCKRTSPGLCLCGATASSPSVNASLPCRGFNPHLPESCAWGRLRFHSAERKTLSPSGCIEKLKA